MPEGADEGPADCAVCFSALGKRHLRPKHFCKVCTRAVCATCSPGLLVLKSGQPPQRTCNECMFAAVAAPERICHLTMRLKELLLTTTEGGKEVSRTVIVKLDDRAEEEGDYLLEQSLDYCEAAMTEAEDAAASLRRRADRAEAVALTERQLRQQIEEQLIKAKEAALELGKRLHEATHACEAFSAPLAAIKPAEPDVEAWGRERELTENIVKESERRAQVAKDRLLSIGDRLLQIPGSQRRPYRRPRATDPLDDLTSYCDAAITSLQDAAAELAQEREREKEEEFAMGHSPSSRRSMSSATISGTGMEGHCGACNAPFGKRHLTRRHRCDLCQIAFCSSCSRMLRSCDSCLEEAKTCPDILERVDLLADEIRSATGKKPRGCQSINLKEALSACQQVVAPLKDIRAGNDVSKHLLLEVRKMLDQNAKAAAAVNADLGARLMMLCEQSALPGKAPVSSSSLPSPLASTASPAESPVQATPKRNPASPDFWSR